MPETLTQIQTFRFDEMAILVKDKIDNPAEANVDRYVGLEHLDPESLKIRRWGATTDVEASKLLFKSGDIIFGKRRVYQRKLAVADFDGICSAHAMVLRPKPEVVLPEFLPFFMQSDLFMERALEISVGSLSPTINWKTLAKQEFALPPLDEQRRIAEALNACERNFTSLTETYAAAKRAHQSSCIAMGDALRESPDTSWGDVGDLGEVRMGRQRSPKYQTGKHSTPYLRVANIYDGYIDVSDVSEMDFDDRDFAIYRLKRGDILLNEGQSRELVGRSAIYKDEVENCCFQNTLIRFRSDSVSPDFAQTYFRYLLYSGRFAAASKQTSSMAHLGLKTFTQMKFPVLTKEAQAELVAPALSIESVVRAVDARRKLVKSIKAALLNEVFDHRESQS